MPYIDFVAKDDYASLWYSTNALCRNVGSFDPAKPTIVMLHPLHVDSTWLFPQLNDPRLSERYNIITFDTRVTGASRSRFSGKYDLYVAAADIAHAFYHLRLPPAHIFASEVWTLVALRLAAIFPKLCLSLTLCNVPAQTELKAISDGFEELTRLWCFAGDLETFEHACGLLLSIHAAPHAHPDIADELVGYYQMNWPPFEAGRLISVAQVVLNRTPLNEDELAGIHCPVLICQAETNPAFPLIYAKKLASDLVNVPGGVTLYPVKSSTGLITIFSASIVNKVFSTFLSRLPPARSDRPAPKKSLARTMEVGLQRLAEYANDVSVVLRDPLSPLSFSRVTEEVRRSQEETYRTFEMGQRKAFSPLGPNGRPIRKFSERKDDHCLPVETDGFSYVGRILNLYATNPNNADIYRHDLIAPTTPASDLPPTEPMSAADQASARSRRYMIGRDFTALRAQVV
ncbi:alpha/beta-hydrolase [Cristinia sonorae]|uniref:Alpha/beta-hydrolase n=1 Tax=Cristinia sonorae TaxID=1940300 RepID=A0A8K0USI1_9AGAR|nr:alpha/beta-hydrolase [Cristinia sonorae]